MQTLYDVLHVPMSASQGELQHAYRRLLTRVHPDRCYHDNDSVSYNTAREVDHVRMNALQRAYKVLGDPQKRNDYDACLTRQFRRESAAYHRPPQQVFRPQGMAQPQVLTFVGSVSGTGGVLKTLTDLAEANDNTAPFGAGSRSAARPPAAAEEGAFGASNPQYSNPMTRALGTFTGVAEGTAARQDGAVAFSKPPSSSAPPSRPVGYTASAATQRQPDDAVSKRAIETGPRTVGLVVVTDGGVALGALASTAALEASQQPSAAVATAAPAAETDAHLPRRLRVVEEHLAIRL
ncbi:hypothetical protein LSCM1_07204 [Leishmania martiniquensis]|uniref:J domain-containing protein n=1 Tax=Leishmania martiniquensis TaxID=1580590 RepID=A0A836HGJ6_9TRYP|nr:hypothetical protein LSCM1_07204 [Leishmania martiniquensis]